MRHNALFAVALLTLTSAHGYGQIVAVTDFADSGRSLQRSSMVHFQDSLYFSVGVNNTDIRELWRFDGAHLDRIYDGFRGTSELALGEFTVFQDNLYFRANDGSMGDELYRFDGQQVRLVADLQPGDGSSSPTGLTVHNDALYFSAQAGDSFNNLWRYDGAQVEKIASFGNPRSSVVMGASLGDDLYFGADDGTHGMELWKYDGQETSIVSDMNEGPTASYPRDFIAWDDRLIFKATTPEVGQELFQWDGDSVSLFADTNPGPKSSDTGYLTIFEGDLYFSGLAWSARNLYRTEGDRIVRVMKGGGPIDLGTGELAVIRGHRENGIEINEFYLLDETFHRSTVPSAGSFETFQDNVYFSCECPLRELFRLAKEGDTNADGEVNFSDFLIISRHFGSSGDWDRGDFDDDGRITFSDFLAMSKNFGVESQPTNLMQTTQGVPEPTAGPLFALALALLGRCRPSRQSYASC